MQINRLRHVDDMRGIAVLIVMLFHYFGSTLPRLSFGQ
jgi:peptidoglycan/LPS O-acetylase OafA/YrhL